MESERSYSVFQVAQRWGITVGLARLIFRGRPGVIRRQPVGRRFARVRIPQSLFDQVEAERARQSRVRRAASPDCLVPLSRVSCGQGTTTVAAESLFEAAIEGLRWFEVESRRPSELLRLPNDAVLTVEMAGGRRSQVRVDRVRAWERFLNA